MTHHGMIHLKAAVNNNANRQSSPLTEIEALRQRVTELEVLLRASEARYRAMLLGPDGMKRMERESRLLVCNEQFAQLDVTTHKQLTAELQALCERLEECVQECACVLATEVGAQGHAALAAAKRMQELEILHTLSRVVSVSLDPDVVIQTALDQIIAMPNTDVALLFLQQGATLQLLAQRALQLQWRVDAVTATHLSAGLQHAGVLEGKTLYFENMTAASLNLSAAGQQGELRSLIALPLRSRDIALGVLALGAVKPDAFAEHGAFLETVADHVAVGLQNALWYKQISERNMGLEALVAERVRELCTERDRTQAILDTLGEAVIVTDMAGQVLFANPAKSELTGYSREELLGRPLWQRWNGDPAVEIWPTIRRELQERRMWHGEISGRRKDGASYTAATTGALLHDADMATAEDVIVWVQRDITLFKEAEHLKNAFVSNVSHELRTPLAAIVLISDNLLSFYERLDEQRRRRMLEDLHAQAHLLVDLVEDVLQIARIDDRRVSPVRDWVDLAELVQQELESCYLLVRQKSQHLIFVCEITAPVWVNEVQIRRAFRNLLHNAIKFTPVEGQISCTCTIETAGTETWAVIRISDSGMGIAAEDLPHIFERFYRAQKETHIPGTGLGLPIAQELVELHGGHITVVSTPGVGSTFTLSLPLRSEEI